MQTSNAKAIKYAVLIDEHRGAEDDHEREHNRDHCPEWDYKGSERNPDDCKDNDHRDDHCHWEEPIDSILNIVPASEPRMMLACGHTRAHMR